MFKRLIFLALLSGILAGVACLIYQRVYATSLGSGFDTIIKPIAVFSSCLVGCILASVAYWLLDKWMGSKGEIVFNFVFVLLTFVSIVGPFATKLPLTIETPELFPGLTVPMHFFPVLAWFTLRPLFIKKA